MTRQPTSDSRPVRTIRYRDIADDLRGDIHDGRSAPGSRLESEAELALRFGVSRVTIRSALDILRDEGLVESRQGLGWMVSAAPFRQSLEQLGTIEDMVVAAGRRSERRVLDFRFSRPPASVAELMGDGQTLVVRRLNSVDGAPFAVVTVWCPERFGAEMSRRDVERATFLDQLPVAIGGATQIIGASTAASADAEVLDVAAGSPVLTVTRVTRASTGEVVLVSEHVFPADRMEFVAELSVREHPGVETAFRFVDDPSTADDAFESSEGGG